MNDKKVVILEKIKSDNDLLKDIKCSKDISEYTRPTKPKEENISNTSQYCINVFNTF